MGLQKRIGKFLAKKSRLQDADAIVVVSGGAKRVHYAISLYKKGYAPNLIFSGASGKSPVSDAMRMKQIANVNGISDRNISLDEKSVNTYENALNVKKIVLKHKFRNIILVTSPYHQRRVYKTFKKVFEKTTVILQNAPSVFSPWQHYNWWSHDRGLSLTISELSKLFMIKVFKKYK